MIELRFSVEGEKQFVRRMQGREKDLGDTKPVMRHIGQELRDSIDANYSARGALFGKWEPRKDKKPHPLLEKTGKMRSGFKERVGKGYVEISNPTDYFKYHQSNKPRKKIPRRIMIKIDDIRKRFIQKEFQRHMQEAMRKK